MAQENDFSVEDSKWTLYGIGTIGVNFADFSGFDLNALPFNVSPFNETVLMVQSGIGIQERRLLGEVLLQYAGSRTSNPGQTRYNDIGV